MRVYVVMAGNEMMSVCGDKQTAEWDKDLCEMEGNKDVAIKECGVVTYNEDSFYRQRNALNLMANFAKKFQ